MRTNLLGYQTLAVEQTLKGLLTNSFHQLSAGMGTGKTLMSMTVRGGLSVKRTIIVAPKTLLRGFVADVHKHLEDPPAHLIWESASCKTQYFRRNMLALLEQDSILLVNYEAFGRKNEFLEEYLKHYLSEPTFVIFDESSRVKDHSSHRTVYLSKVFQGAKYKLGMTGTLNEYSPLDVYGQFLVLDPDFWKKRGFRNWHLFEKTFAIIVDGYRQGGAKYPKRVGYQKVELLRALIDPHLTVVDKYQVLDLPEKVFDRIQVSLSEEEDRVYRDLKRNMMVTLQSGEFISVEQKISLYQKFRQICGGWVDPDTPILKPGEMPSKLAVLLDVLEDNTEQVVIFAVFTHEIDQITQALGSRARKYDGSVSVEERSCLVNDFNSGKFQYLVVQPKAGAYGLNLQASCNTVFYYSRPNSPEEFVQSQDRIHRIGQTKTCFYIDLVVEGKIDEKVIEALDQHKSLASMFNSVTASNINDFL